MNKFRLVSYLTDPFRDEMRAVAAIVGTGGAVVVARASLQQLPATEQRHAERILAAIDAAPSLDALPFTVGMHAVLGELRDIPPTVTDPVNWVRVAILGGQPESTADDGNRPSPA